MYIATSLGIKNQPHGKKHTMSRGQDLRTNQPTQGTYKAKHFHVFYYSSISGMIHISVSYWQLTCFGIEND